MHRRFRSLAAFVGLAGALASCGGDSPTDPNGGNGNGSLPPPTLSIEHSLVAPDSVLVGDRVEYSVSSDLTSDGSAVVDSLVNQEFLNGSLLRRVVHGSGTVSDVTEHSHSEGDVSSLESCVYATAVNADHRVSDVDCVSQQVHTEIPLQYMTVDFETKYFFTGEVNNSITVRVTHPESGIVVEGESLEGLVSLEVPQSDSLLVTPVASGRGVHKVAGHNHQYHLGVASGKCFVTDAYDDSFMLPVGDGRFQLETVPVEVPILLAAFTNGQMGGASAGTTPVNVAGSLQTLDRSQPHTLLAVDGRLENPFVTLPFEDEHEDAMNVLYDSFIKVLTHERIPTGCLPYTNLDEFISFKTISPQTFLNEYWDGTVSGGDHEPAAPGTRDFIHLFYRAHQNRASGSFSYDGSVFSFVKSLTDTRMAGPGLLFSEFQGLGHSDSRVENVCAHKNRIVVDRCYDSGSDGWSSGVLDDYVTDMTRDEVAALVLTHTFGAVAEKVLGRNFHLFRTDADYWQNARKLDNEPDR